MAKINNRPEAVLNKIHNQASAALPGEPNVPPLPARRVNGFVAGLAVLAGSGAIALAVLVAPGAAPSLATASHAVEGAAATGEAPRKGDRDTQPASIAAKDRPEIVVAGLPHRAAKSDRLSRWSRTPQPPVADRWLNQSLNGPERDDAAGAFETPETASKAPPEPQESFGSPEPNEAGVEDSAAMSATRSAPVTTAVNMRAGPDNAAAVITVVPASGVVEVIGCQLWCEVIFAGERGWIYKSFVAGAQS